MAEELIISTLSNYGALGVWTLTLLFERYKMGKKTQEVIENNTNALTKIYEAMNKCPKTKR